MGAFLLFVITGGFLVGVFTASIFEKVHAIGFFLSSAFVVMGIGVALFSFFSSYKTKIIYIAFAVIFFGLGIVRFSLATLHDYDPVLETLVGQEVIVEGIIIEDPDRRLVNMKLTLKVKNFTFKEKSYEIHSKLLITVEPYLAIEYGDLVRVTGKLQKPENFMTDTGREFDYEAYLGKEGIFYTLGFVHIEVLSVNHGNFLKRWLLGLKDILTKSIDRNLKRPESALLLGILLGEKSGLSQALQDDFRKTGLVHVLVLSGYNITIVGTFFAWCFRFLKRPRLALVLSAISILLFALLVGFEATVVRASLMALLVLLARSAGREYDASRALAIAAFIMVLHNPKILIHDISFQLSFLATIGLIYIAPLIEERTKFLPSFLQLRETFAQTVSAQIIVLPLILFYMGELSIVALPVNLLVLFTIPYAMLFGLLMSLAGIVSNALTFPFMFPTYALLHYVLKVVGFFAHLPFASVTIKQFPWWGMVVGYVVMMFIFWKMGKKVTIDK